MSSCRMPRARLSFALLFVAVAAYADVRIDLVGHWGGRTYVTKVRADLAYVGIGPRLVIIDVHDPTRPVRIGETEPLGHVISDIALEGSFAFVSTYYGGFKVVDIADPAQPRLVGEHALDPYYDAGVSVAARDGYAFVLHRDSGLHVFDVSDPTAPEQVSAYEFTGSLHEADDIAIAGDIAYVITWSRLVLLDIGDPYHPRFISDLPMGATSQIEIDGDYAYIVGYSLLVVDVSQPQTPFIAAEFPDLQGWGLALAPDRLYVQATWTGNRMTVIDRTHPTQLVWRGWTPMESAHGGGMAVAGTQVYASDLYTGVRVIDAENPDDPVQVGMYRDVADSYRISAANGRAYSGGSTLGTQVLDVSNPSHTARIAEWSDPLGRRMLTFQVELRDYLAYVASAERGPGTDREFTILDVSDLSMPRRIGRLALQNVPNRFVLDGSYAYIANHYGGFLVVDISTPDSPQVIRTVDTGWAFDVVLQDHLAYVATYTNGLQIVDVSNPSDPRIVGGKPFGEAYSVVLFGDVAFLGTNNGLQVVDVADPTSPELLPLSLGWSQVQRLTKLGNYLIAPMDPGMWVYDATTPREPRLIGTYASQGWEYGVTVSDGLVFLASADGGLEILAIRPPGDLDGDGVVGIFDLTSLLSSFGSCAADATYNRYADLDGDECVTLQDLAGVLAAFGR